MESTFSEQTDKHVSKFAINAGSSQLTLRFSERKLLLAVGDLIILNLALLMLAGQYNSRFELAWANIWDRAYWFLLISVMWLLMGSLFGVYDLARAASPLRSAWVAGRTALLTSGLYLLIPYLTPALPTRRIYLFAFPLLATVGISLWRLLYATVFAHPGFRQRALVVGAGTSGNLLAEAIHSSQDGPGNPYEGTGYEIVGFVDDAPEKQNAVLAGIPVLGTSEHLLDLVKVIQPYEVVLAITHRDRIRPELFQAVMDCRELGVPITTMTDLYELVTGRVPVQHAGNNLDVVLPVRRPASFRVYLVLHRLLDILVASVGCLFLLAVIPAVWLANRLSDPGDLFYRQERVRLGGKPFQVLKFRSMIMDAEKHTGAVWAGEDDSRVTPAGRFFRKTRLDEVPQFWNILKGDMSLIGPRPERPFFVQQLAQTIPFYRVRHAAKPGLTGWAQVKYRYGASEADALIKLEYDLYYIKNQSAFLDLEILIKTIQVVLGFKGR